MVAGTRGVVARLVRSQSLLDVSRSQGRWPELDKKSSVLISVSISSAYFVISP